jgi:hypothetical protein
MDANVTLQRSETRWRSARGGGPAPRHPLPAIKLVSAVLAAAAALGVVRCQGSVGAAAPPGPCCQSRNGCPIDCTTDADCMGAPCAELTPGGVKVCLLPPCVPAQCITDEPPAPSQIIHCGPGHQCVVDSFDTGPYCYGGTQGGQCVSTTDACTSDAMCGVDEICAPRGAFYSVARACVLVFCKTDADCTASPGGRCIVFPDVFTCQVLPACVYPGGCTGSRDESPECDGGTCHLDPVTHAGVCCDGGPCGG